MSSVFDEIPRRVPTISDEGEAELWDALEIVLGERCGQVRQSMRTVLLRVLELSLLADPVFVDIARYPQTYLGDAHTLIEARLIELFGARQIPRSLVEHLRAQLLSGVGVDTTKSSTGPNIQAVLSRCLNRSPARELRCEICGYQFVREDLGVARQAIAARLEAKFARFRLPGRLRDTWKPADQCGLAIDHVIPEAALGPTADENLQVTCDFCNSAKQIYRWPGEALSRDNAGSMGLLVAGSRMMWAVKAAVFSTLASNGACTACGGTPLNVELTARRVGGGRAPGSLAPWVMEAVCYECFDPAM